MIYWEMSMTPKYKQWSRREFLFRGFSGLIFLGTLDLTRPGSSSDFQAKNSFDLQPGQDIAKSLVDGIRENFIKALRQRLGMMFPGEEEKICEEIKADDLAIIAGGQSWVTDTHAELHLMLTSIVLATYRILSQKIPYRETVLDITRYAFFEGQQHAAAKAQFLAMVEKEPDPFAMLVKVSKYKEENQYGKTFVFERERDDEKFYFLNVHKCFYHDFFSAHNAQDLTPVFCDWDDVWGDELKDGRFGVKFERPETLGYGASMCRFQFSKTERKKP